MRWFPHVVRVIGGALSCVACAAQGPSTEPGNGSTEANKVAVLAFYDAALNQKDFEAARRYLGPRYIQHNPNAADGIDGFAAFIAATRARTPDSHSRILRVIAEGDYVVLHVRKVPRPGDLGKAIVDIFRLENGRIVEHWDVSQDIPERTASGNPIF
jgi:predicted SnoaL-like aldol condensation-catalyzing enzyme